MTRNFTSSLLSRQITEASSYCPKTRHLKSPGLDVLSAGKETCCADYLIDRSRWPWLSIELIAKGEGWLEMSGQRLRVQTGTLFSYGPRVSFKMTNDPRHPMVKYFVTFVGSEARRLMFSGPLSPGRVCHALYPHELVDILDRVIHEGNRHSRLAREIANNYTRLFLQKLHDNTLDFSDRKRARALASYLRAKALLDEAFTVLPNAEAAARKLGMSPETLCRLFHRFSNSSPFQYLQHMKINRAVDILLGSDLMVKEVGQNVGFDDQFQFSRTFKRLQGVSPDNFRRHHRMFSGKLRSTA